jgi:hypothetical protein
MLQPFLLVAAIAASPTTDCARDGLMGPVHTAVTRIQTIQLDVHGKPDTAQLMVGEATYDRACNLVESKDYKGDFVDDQHFTRVDATTLLVRSNMGDRTVHERYDGMGRRIETQTTKATGEVVEHSRYTYGADGLVSRIDSLDSSGKPYDYTTFAYDSKGDVMREVTHFGDGRSQISVSTYRFDSRGNWIQEFDSQSDPDDASKPIRAVDILFRTITYY